MLIRLNNVTLDIQKVAYIKSILTEVLIVFDGGASFSHVFPTKHYLDIFIEEFQMCWETLQNQSTKDLSPRIKNEPRN